MKRWLACVLLLCAPAHAAEEGSDAPPPPVVVAVAESLLACKKLDPGKRLRITLHGEVGVGELVAALAPLSCRPIVVGGSVSRAGKVSIDAPDLLAPREAIDLLVTAIDSLGLSLEESGPVLRVVDSARGKEIATMTGGGGKETFVLRLVRLEEVGADEVAATVGKLRSKDGEVIAVASSRTLLLVDRLAQVERMEALARALDRPALPAHMFVLPTHRQRPSDLIDAVEKIALGTLPKSDKPDPNRPMLIAVDGARVILLSGGELAYQRVEALLERIDPPLRPGEERGGRIAVFYLKHVSAEDLAATLKEVLTQARRSTSSAATVVGGITPGAIEGEVKLVADKESNSLVATGSVSDLDSVRELVGRLDLPRRQVYVEIAVLDLSADLSRAVGIALSQAGSPTRGSGALVSSSSSTVSTINTATLASALGSGGLLAGLLGSNVDIAGQTIPSFGVVIQALETSKNASVISRPHLLTLDHQKASILVGQKIPFPVGNIAAASGGPTGVALSTTYSREDVALKFDLTPHLSDDEEIRLELEGEISDVASTGGPGGPITNQRKLKTTVVVHDGETVVLGGLQKESALDSVERVPFLGEIPVLGKLFQTKTKSRTKQDLLIVLTPYVVRDQSDLRRIYDRKEAERRELIERSTMFGDPHAYDPHVDYARKRGLLEEINRAARLAEEEGNALDEARAQLGRGLRIAPGEVRVAPSH
ncbi:MAG: type II secretion system secretin GspD [Polyangia bacterium]